MKIQYKGIKRPLSYVTNYGDVYLNDGDILEIRDGLVYKNDVFNYESYHRHFAYLSNLIPHKIHGFVCDENKEIEIFKNIIEGKELSQLEYDLKCIKSISENLPKENISLSHYQFSNNVRPISKYIFKDGLYYGSNYENGGTSLQISWYIYRNLFKVIPFETKNITSEEWEQVRHLY